jgi:hypothetical protein
MFNRSICILPSLLEVTLFAFQADLCKYPRICANNEICKFHKFMSQKTETVSVNFNLGKFFESLFTDLANYILKYWLNFWFPKLDILAPNRWSIIAIFLAFYRLYSVDKYS